MKHPIFLLRPLAVVLLFASFSPNWRSIIPIASAADSAPAAATAPAAAKATPPANTPVAAPAENASDNGGALARKATMDAAVNALNLIKTMQADEFLGPGQHAAVAKDLTALKNVVNDVKNDDGKNSANFNTLIGKFVDAINQMISRLNSTARRAQESNDNKAKCTQWSEQWTKIRMSFQPAAKTAQQAAADALALVKAMQADSEFLGPGRHAAVAKDLTALESAANDVKSDAGKDSTASKALSDKFAGAINQMISRLNSAARRTQESEDSKVKCAQWSAQWTKIRISFRPNFENMPAPGKASADAQASAESP